MNRRMDRVCCSEYDLNAGREAAILAKWDRIEAEDLARRVEEADLDVDGREGRLIVEATPPCSGLTFSDIMRDTGLDMQQVRTLLAYLDVPWNFDGHTNRVDRGDYVKVRDDLRSVVSRLVARDRRMSRAP